VLRPPYDACEKLGGGSLLVLITVAEKFLYNGLYTVKWRIFDKLNCVKVRRQEIKTATVMTCIWTS
jgi:hypothetical protein